MTVSGKSSLKRCVAQQPITDPLVAGGWNGHSLFPGSSCTVLPLPVPVILLCSVCPTAHTTVCSSYMDISVSSCSPRLCGCSFFSLDIRMRRPGFQYPMGHPVSEQSTSPILTRKERCEIDLFIGWSYSLAAEHGLYETLGLSSALQEE